MKTDFSMQQSGRTLMSHFTVKLFLAVLMSLIILQVNMLTGLFFPQWTFIYKPWPLQCR